MNDVDTGAAWVTSTARRVDRVDDWGNDLSSDRRSGDDDSDEPSGESTEERRQPRRRRRRRSAGRPDRRGRHRTSRPSPATTRPRTRIDQPIDRRRAGQRRRPRRRRARSSTSVSGQPADAQVTPTADRTARAGDRRRPGSPATSTFALHDHRRARRHGATPTSPSTVSPADGSDNRPPVADTDIAEARAGAAGGVRRAGQRQRPRRRRARARSRPEGPTRGRWCSTRAARSTFTPDPTATAGTASS